MQKDDPGLLSEIIRQSDQLKVHNRLNVLQVHYFVMARNKEELDRFVEAINRPEVVKNLHGISNRQNLNVARDEASRLLTNFLASALFFMDATDELVSAMHPRGEVQSNYWSKRREQLETPGVYDFIKQLRDYALHHRLLAPDAVYFGDTDQLMFYLDKSDLEAWERDNKWRGKAAQLLRSQPRRIDIAKVAEIFFRPAKEFHAWLYDYLKEVHSDELKWLEEMTSRVRASLGGGGITGTGPVSQCFPR